jgi:hypothetical protein
MMNDELPELAPIAIRRPFVIHRSSFIIRHFLLAGGLLDFWRHFQSRLGESVYEVD